MDALTVEGRAAGYLLAEKESLARGVTAALYDEFPDLIARHGQAGRDRCLEDLRYTIEHLIPAVDLDEPTMFVRYAQWLDALLTARNVSTREVIRSFEILDRFVRERVSADEAEAVSRCVRAAVDAVTPTVRSEP